MNLKSRELIQINSTIIMSLLILYFFQFFSSTIVENEIKTYFDELNRADRNLDKLERLLETCRTENPTFVGELNDASKFLDKCENYRVEKIELIHELTSLEVWGSQHGYLDIDQYSISGFVEYLKTASIYVRVINIAMIFPFAISAIREFIFILKEKDAGDSASQSGVKITISGFVILVIGLSAITFLMVQSAVPFLNASDTDADGLYDLAEIELGTDIENPDTDGDGSDDFEEYYNTLTDPLDPNSVHEAYRP